MLTEVIDLWLHMFTDLFVTALMERISERRQHMFSPKIILWGGVASAFSGMFWMMGGTGSAAGVIALVLGLGGLASLYSSLAGQGGKLGLAGFALGILGTVLTLVAQWWESTIFSGPSYAVIHSRIERDPTLAAQAILFYALGLVILGIGLALLGLASLRTKTLHRWPGLPLGLGLLTIILSITIVLLAYVPLSQGRNPFDPWPPQGYAFLVAELVLLGLGWMGLGTTLAAAGDTQIPIGQPPSASA